MFDFWKSAVSGNLTDDPEFRKSKEGREYATFSIAANTDSDSSVFISIYCFERRHIDFAMSSLKKGSGIVVIGSLQQRKAQSGDKTYLRLVPTDICLKAALRTAGAEDGRNEGRADEEDYF